MSAGPVILERAPAVSASRRRAPCSAREVDMALAPEQLTLGLRRHFTTGAVSPLDMVSWERRDTRLMDWRTGEVSFEQLGVEFPSTLVRQRLQHRGPEVLPRHARHPRARMVAAPGHRPGRRHHHRLGRPRRLLRRPRRARHLRRRAEVPPRHPARRVQQPGVVQHRRARRAEPGLGVLHPRRSTTRSTPSSTGTARRASSSRVARAPGSTCRRSGLPPSRSRAAARPSGR